MAYRQEKKCSRGWRGFNLESSFEWRTTIICTRAYLILVYINDLEEKVTSEILKFADDNKLLEKIWEMGIKQRLPHDIDKLVKWAEELQMLFNFEKC